MLGTRKDAAENKVYPYILLCAKAYRSVTSGCRGTPHFRRYDREMILEQAISLKKGRGGYRRTTLARVVQALDALPDPE